MIGGLQGEFRDLDNKISQKVGRKYQEASREILLHCAKWRLGRQYYQSLLFDCGRKWIRRIASV